MRRRTVLALLAGAGLSGCSLADESSTVTPATVPEQQVRDDSDVGASPPGTWPAGANDVAVGDRLGRTLAVYTAEPRQAPVQTTVGFSTVDGRPTWLLGAIVNTSSSTREVDLDRFPQFSAVPNAVSSDGGVLVLAPRPGHERSRTRPPAERGSDGRWRLSEPVDPPWLDTDPVSLDPDERIRFAYALVSRHDGPGFTTGRYRFRRDDRTVTVVVWQSSAPGPDVDSRFSDPALPSLPVEGARIWYHDSGPETAIFLQPSAERVDLPTTVTYRFVNHARTISGTRWLFLKLVDGEWYDLTPAGQSLYRRGLVPGGVERWDLSLAHGALSEERTAVGYLGGGDYAFVVDVGYSPVVRAALLSVDAPQVRITPDEDISVDREGATVTVTDASWDHDGTDSARLTVERGDGAGQRRIREQVAPHSGYRNTLPLFEDGVDRVVLRTNQDTVRDVLGREQSLTVRFDGDTYRVEKGDPE